MPRKEQIDSTCWRLEKFAPAAGMIFGKVGLSFHGNATRATNLALIGCFTAIVPPKPEIGQWPPAGQQCWLLRFLPGKDLHAIRGRAFHRF